MCSTCGVWILRDVLLLCIRLVAMKPTGYWIDISRGGIVDTDALLDVRENGDLGGFAMDMYVQCTICLYQICNFSSSVQYQKSKTSWSETLSFSLSILHRNLFFLNFTSHIPVRRQVLRTAVVFFKNNKSQCRMSLYCRFGLDLDQNDAM